MLFVVVVVDDVVCFFIFWFLLCVVFYEKNGEISCSFISLLIILRYQPICICNRV